MATSITPGGQVPTSAKVGAQVGRSLPRLEARAKVTGRAEYTHTMRLPGMLHAKLFRSTVPHGKIKSVDTRAAEKLPGVVQVITAEYEELPAVYDEIDALTAQTFVHEELRPAGTFTDLKHLQGMTNTN